MLDFEILGIKSQNQLNPCAVPSDAVKMEAKNTAPLEYIGESEELWNSECDRQVKREKVSEVGKAQREQSVASDGCILGMEDDTKTLLHLVAKSLVTWVDKHKGPTFTVQPLGGRADGIRQKLGTKPG